MAEQTQVTTTPDSGKLGREPRTGNPGDINGGHVVVADQATMSV